MLFPVYPGFLQSLPEPVNRRLPRHFVARNDRWGRLEQPLSTEIAGYPFRSVYRGRAVAKIDAFLGRGNEYCTHNSARLEGSGEVALIAGATKQTLPSRRQRYLSCRNKKDTLRRNCTHSFPKGYRFRRKRLPNNPCHCEPVTVSLAWQSVPPYSPVGWTAATEAG